MSAFKTLLLITLYISVCSIAANAQTLPTKPIDFEVLRDFFAAVDVIAEGDQVCTALDTIVADDRARWSRGLMYVRTMPPRSAMLFDYEQPRALSMWMKNTLIPLDIVFASGDGRIINIVRDTVPLSLDSIRATVPAVYVLELNAGVADQLGLKSGSRLLILR